MMKECLLELGKSEKELTTYDFDLREPEMQNEKHKEKQREQEEYWKCGTQAADLPPVNPATQSVAPVGP